MKLCANKFVDVADPTGFRSSFTHRLPLVALLFFVGVSGCSPGKQLSSNVTVAAAERPRTGVSGKESDGSPATSRNASVGKEITLTVADTKLFQQVLEQNRGNVVLVDFWATWCVSCKKNFPKIVQYGEKYKDAGLVVVSLSIDDLSAQEDAVRFLRSVKAGEINLISKWGAGTESAEKFDFSGEVPFYRLYDRKGALRYEFSANPPSNSQIESLEQIEPRLQQLLDYSG